MAQVGKVGCYVITERPFAIREMLCKRMTKIKSSVEDSFEVLEENIRPRVLHIFTGREHAKYLTKCTIKYKKDVLNA